MFFGKSKRKNIINEAVLDLRKYTPGALENVKIINAALVIFPENPGEALMDAYGKIKIKNVAVTLNVPDDKKIINFNGTTVLGDENVVPGAIHMTNGLTVIKSTPEEPVELISNGLTVYGENTRLNILTQNGLSAQAPFQINDVRIFPHDIGIDSLFVKSLTDNTVIAAGNDMIIYSDVSLELLKSKKLYFVAGSLIKCDYSILGYIQTIATAGKKIQVNES